MRKLLPYFLFILGISNANCAQENLVIWHGLDEGDGPIYVKASGLGLCNVIGA